MAVLEEWIQEKYVEYYDEAGNYPTKLDLLANKVSGLFFKASGQNYIVSAIDGETKKYYLIDKSNLPKEVKSSLVGGDATEYSDYLNFFDVYGVTEDLKVYYCKNGITEGVYGKLGGNKIDPNQVLTKLEENEEVKSAIAEALGLPADKDITVGDVEGLKTLKLNNPNIKSLSALGDIYSLRNLTLEELSLDNLDGLENCGLLEKIYFKSTKVGNYSNLCSNYNLKEIYVYLNNSWTKEECNTEISNFGNGLSGALHLTNVERLGISGNVVMLENTDNYRSDYFEKENEETRNVLSVSFGDNSHSHLISIDGLKNINSNLKSKVKYLYLNNNSLNSITSLSGFSNVTYLMIMNNRELNSLDGVENLENLKYLYGCRCYKGTTSGVNSKTYTGLSDISKLKECSNLGYVYLFDNLALQNLTSFVGQKKINTIVAYDCSLNDIKGLSGLTSLKYLDIHNNPDLKEVLTLGELEGLDHLYLAGNTKMNGEQLGLALDGTGILANCGANSSLPSGYNEFFEICNPEYLLGNKNLTRGSKEIQKFLTRSDVTNIKRLDLSFNTGLTNQDLQDVLSRMTELQVLSLNGCSQLSTIGFIGKNKVTKLVELDLRGTQVTDLANLEEYGLSLSALILDNKSTDFSTFQETINRFKDISRSNDLSFYNVAGNTLSCYGLILTGDASSYSFSEDCTSIKSLFIGCSLFNTLQSGKLDLGNLSGLRSIHLRYIGFGVELPSGLTSYRHQGGDFSCDLAACKNLDTINLDTVSEKNCIAELNSISVMPKKLAIVRQGVKNLNFLTPSNARELDYLELGWGRMDDSGDLESLSGLENAVNLTSLTLNGLKNLKDFNNIYTLSKLMTLRIKFSKSSTLSELILSKDGKSLSSLQTLEISDNENIKRITGLSDISSLTSLTLRSTGISDITGLSNQTGLTTLELSDNQISDLEELNGLIRNCSGKVKFTELNLSDNSLTPSTSRGTNNVEIILNLLKSGVKKINVIGNALANHPDLQGKNGIVC